MARALDPQSRAYLWDEVRQLRESPRHYALLGELNTQPRTTYLARVATAEDPEP